MRKGNRTIQREIAEKEYQTAYAFASCPKAATHRKETLELLRAAAEKGHSEAQYALGNWYGHGIGVRKNYKRAYGYFLSAAKQGHPLAQYELASALEMGKGTERNPNEAFRWYHAAASGGNADAESELARCYLYGIGTRRNHKKAAEWCHKAAKSGKPDAQHALGYCYQQGQGVIRNRKQAIRWYKKAAQQGHKDAAIALKDLTARYHDSRTPILVSVQMSDVQTQDLLLQLHQLQPNSRVPDVLGPVCDGLAVDYVAGFEVGFHHTAINAVRADLAAFNHVDHVCRMRMNLFLVTRLEYRFQHAHTRVLQLQRNRF